MLPRYFFDIEDGGSSRDDTGVECADIQAVRRAAMRTLPDIARDEILGDGDRRNFTVVARDEGGNAVYTATLSFTGLWLTREPDGPAA